MNKKEFLKLIKKDKFQVFLFITPIPFNFITHPWFVIVQKGTYTRWEVWGKQNMFQKSWGHVHQCSHKPWQGMKRILFRKTNRFESKLIGVIEGKEGSIAEKMGKYIIRNSKTYKHTYTYRFVPGPNSNTFVQHFINKFPESGFVLPKTCIGKGYKVKN